MSIAELHLHPDSASAQTAPFQWLYRHGGAVVLLGCLAFWSALAAGLYFAL
jgi:hypothetical protein